MPSFPSSWLNLSDSALGELSAQLAQGAASLTLKAGDGAKFPASDFLVKIDSEVILVATRTTDTLSGLTRGFDSTADVLHVANSKVWQSACKSLFQRIINNIAGHTHVKSEVTDLSDWTYVRLASDFVTGSATAVDVTGMSLTPAANLRYEIEGILLLRTATATVGPRPGIAWPTGMTDGVGMIDTTSSATARLLTNGNVNAALLAAVGGLPNATQSWPGKVHATLIAGASPGSSFRIQLASETAATNVTMKAGSFFRWRTF